MKSYRFDFLEKIEYTAELLKIQLLLESKLDDYKKKNPNIDITEQQITVNNLFSIYKWLVGLFENKEIILQHNNNLQKLILDLKIENIKLTEELTKIKQQDKF